MRSHSPIRPLRLVMGSCTKRLCARCWVRWTARMYFSLLTRWPMATARPWCRRQTRCASTACLPPPRSKKWPRCCSAWRFFRRCRKWPALQTLMTPRSLKPHAWLPSCPRTKPSCSTACACTGVANWAWHPMSTPRSPWCCCACWRSNPPAIRLKKKL